MRGAGGGGGSTGPGATITSAGNGGPASSDGGDGSAVLTWSTAPNVQKPSAPQKLRVSGGAKASKKVIHWNPPKASSSTRPVTSYRITLNVRGCKTLVVNKSLSKNRRRHTLKRSFLLKKKNSTCSRTRGEVVSKRVKYRVRVVANNSQGRGPATSRNFKILR